MAGAMVHLTRLGLPLLASQRVSVPANARSCRRPRSAPAETQRITILEPVAPARDTVRTSCVCAVNLPPRWSPVMPGYGAPEIIIGTSGAAIRVSQRTPLLRGSRRGSELSWPDAARTPQRRSMATLSANFGKLPRRRWKIRAIESDSDAENENPILGKAAQMGHLGLSLAAILLIDKLLKARFLAHGIRFPSALFGMFCIFTFLIIADALKPDMAAAFVGFFQPAITFIQRWLPLFYVPSLVVVPLAVQGIPTAAAAKIALILVGGWGLSLAVAGFAAMKVRSIVKTELQPAEFTPKPAPFANWELKVLASAAVLFLGLAVWSPTAFGSAASTVLPFFLSATALGYVLGSDLPAGVRKIFHPIITCAITADIAAAAYGSLTKTGFEGALKLYLTKQPGNPGAGDIFMGFLGSVILSFAFSMFRQRKLVKRHAAEIFSAVAAASVFSLYSTAAVGRLIGLPSGLTLAVVPRCVTVALALPIAGLLEAGNPSVTAAVVVLTGLVGANFSQLLMDKLGLNDPISRGMATASSGHGLGTAALSAKEPEALPFCAIAYALTGIFCSLLVSVPVIQRSLILLAS